MFENYNVKILIPPLYTNFRLPQGWFLPIFSLFSGNFWQPVKSPINLLFFQSIIICLNSKSCLKRLKTANFGIVPGSTCKTLIFPQFRHSEKMLLFLRTKIKPCIAACGRLSCLFIYKRVRKQNLNKHSKTPEKDIKRVFNF